RPERFVVDAGDVQVAPHGGRGAMLRVVCHGLVSTRTPRTGAGQPQSALSGTRNRSVCVSDRNGATEPGAIVGSAERLTVMLSSTSPRPVNSGAVPTSLPVVWTVCDPVSPLSRFSHSTVAELNGNIDAE